MRQHFHKTTGLIAGAGFMALSLATPNGGAFAADVHAIYENVAKVIPGISEDLVKQACQEGSLEAYQVNVEPSVGANNAAFKQLVPCLQLNIINAASGELAQRFQAVQNSGDVPDYYEQFDPALLQKAAKADQFQRYEPTVAKELKTPSPGLWYPEYGVAMGIAYNSNMISEAQAAKLTSWQSVTDPAFADIHFAVVSPSAGGTATTAFYEMLTSSKDGTLARYRPKQFRVFAASRAAGDSLASGESEIAYPFVATTAVQMVFAGAPVRITFPSPVAIIFAGAGIPKKAKHPAAGKLFFEYVLSATAQKTFSIKNGGISANPNVKFENEVAKQPWWKLPKETFDYNVESLTAKIPEIKAAFSKDFAH